MPRACGVEMRGGFGAVPSASQQSKPSNASCWQAHLEVLAELGRLLQRAQGRQRQLALAALPLVFVGLHLACMGAPT